MRPLIISFFLFLPTVFRAQHNAGEYYRYFNRFDKGDTSGLYREIFGSGTGPGDPYYALLAKGDYFLYAGDVKEAFNSFNAAFALVPEKGRDTLNALINSRIGFLHFKNFNYPEALRYFNKASVIYAYHPETYLQAKMYMSTGNIHLDLETRDEAIHCYRAALTFYNRVKDPGRISQVYNNIAIAYTGKEDFLNAERYLDSAMVIRKKMNDLYGIGQTYNNYGAMFYKKKDYIRALGNFKLGYENRITGKVAQAGLLESQVNIGKSYLRLNDNVNALFWLENARKGAIAVGHFEMQKRADEQLKDLYYRTNDLRKAYAVQEEYYHIKDSIFGANEKTTVDNILLQNQFESRIRQDSIANFEKVRSEKLITAEKEKRTTVFLYVLLVGVIGLSVFVFQLYKANVTKKKTNAIITSQRDALDAKQREIIDSINYAKRIQESLLPSERYIERILKRLNKK